MSKPNILFIMADDHASHAMSCYGSSINETPNLDRIAHEGIRFDNCFCTNAICTPSRATILTGKHSHKNGVRSLADADTMDCRQWSFPRELQKVGYQTAVMGKWHLGHGGVSDPQGFDYWNVLPGQGLYHDPEMIEMGQKKVIEGYVTDIITDLCMEWLEDRNPSRPFCLLCHHKAPHRFWEPDEKHMAMYRDIDIPEPATFYDDYANRASAAAAAAMRVGRDFLPGDLKLEPPPGLSPEEHEQWRNYGSIEPAKHGRSELEFKQWAYQVYIKDYLRCVASIDDNIGRVLDYLAEAGLEENTIVIYTSDQGFFLGDHGWFDKRFMYEESLRMPFIVRYPAEIEPATTNDDLVINNDFAPTFLDYAGIDPPGDLQGRSIRPLLQGQTLADWRQSFYYRYWMHLGHHGVPAHYGLRTKRHKLIYYYGEALDVPGAADEPRPREWELFDLEEDPLEMNSVYDDPQYADVVTELTEELARLREEVDDHSTPWEEH